jgi:hypothetical protein
MKSIVMAILSILSCIVIFLAVFFVCWQRWSRPFKFCDTSGWKVYTRLRGILPGLRKEKIRRIIFCKGDETKKADDWSTDFEVPQECIEGAVELLDKAICQTGTIYSMNHFGYPALRIFTDGTGLFGLSKLKIGVSEITVMSGKGFPEDGMKIITDRGKYLVPVSSWEGACPTSLCGADWASRELCTYFIQYKLNVSRQPASYKTMDSNESPNYRRQYWEWLAKYNTPFYYNALTKDLKGKKIEAIVFTIGIYATADPNLEKAGRVGIIGDPDIVNQILGKKIEYDVVFRSPILVLSTIEAFIRAGEESKDGELMGLDTPRFVFLTREKAYIVRCDWWRKKNFVFGFDFKSEKLYEDLHGIFQTARALHIENALVPPSPSFLEEHYKKMAEKKTE